MPQNRLAFLATVLMPAIAVVPSSASAAVITFEDAAEGNLGTYAGVNWNQQWTNYSDIQSPYNAKSGKNRVFSANYTNPTAFFFNQDVTFEGAWFSGYDEANVSFQLFRDGLQVATSGFLLPSDNPTFLSSGFSGVVDEVRVFAEGGYYVMDDVTFSSSGAVPEPATWALMILGFGAVGYSMRRRQKAAVRFA